MALGETLLITGATLAGLDNWHAPALIALLAAFLGTAAMWWVYFDTSSHDGTEAIVHSDDPGRIGAWFHYVHVILIAGVIVSPWPTNWSSCIRTAASPCRPPPR